MTSTQSTSKNVAWGKLWQAGLLAAVIAAVGNTLLYLVAQSFNAVPQSVIVPGPSGAAPITLPSVILMSVVPAAVATVLLALLVRFTPRPALAFGILAGLVFVGMLFGPLSIPEAPARMILVLELMHVVAAATIASLLLRALGRTFQEAHPS